MFIIQFLPKTCNITTHAIAHKALDFDTSAIWLGDVTFLFPLIESHTFA